MFWNFATDFLFGLMKFIDSSGGLLECLISLFENQRKIKL